MDRKIKYSLLFLLFVLTFSVIHSLAQNKSNEQKSRQLNLQIPKELKELAIRDLVEELSARGIVGQGQVTKGSSSFPSQELSNVPNKTIVNALKIKTKGIYPGSDDSGDNRKEVIDITNPAAIKNVARVVALINKDRIRDNFNGTSSLRLDFFNCVPGNENKILCKRERFRDQPTGAIGTGVLVQPDLVATVRHCVDKADLSAIRFVFGFTMGKGGGKPTSIKTDNIYEGQEILGPPGTEWVLIRLTHPVSGHTAAAIRKTGKVGDQKALYMIGHPCGLPAKFADHARVWDNTQKSLFFADLDAFHGNSGSPVFNAETHEVEGLLLRGAPDFCPDSDETGSCWSSVLIYGAGKEKCLRATEFAKYIK